MGAELPTELFASQAAWERWLARNHGRPDGLWLRFAKKGSGVVPDDLRRELDRNPAAREAFAALRASDRYAILYGNQDAKKPETRARRIAKYVADLTEGGQARS